MFLLKLANLFNNPFNLAESSKYLDSKGGVRHYVSRSFDQLHQIPEISGIFVIVFEGIGLLFVGNAADLRSRGFNFKKSLAYDNHGNPNLADAFKRVNGDYSKIRMYVFENSDAEDISIVQQELMNNLRNRGMLLNMGLRAKVTGVEKSTSNNAYSCYIFTHKASGKFYIGSAKNFKQRKWQHLTELKANAHYNRKLQAAWNADPIAENWEWSFMIHGSKEEARAHEESVLKQHVGKDDLILNLSASATDHINSLMTPEIRAKIATTKTVQNRERYGIPVIVDGTEYPSTGAAALATGVNQSTISRWARDPLNRRAQWVDENLRKERLDKLGALKEAQLINLQENGSPSAKRIKVNGIEYATVLLASKVLGMDEKRLRWRANDPTDSEVVWM